MLLHDLDLEVSLGCSRPGMTPECPVEAASRRHPFSAETSSSPLTALRKALTNAVRHADALDVLAVTAATVRCGVNPRRRPRIRSAGAA
jgi:hypothetical protein